MKYLNIILILLSISVSYCQDIPNGTFINSQGDSITIKDSIYVHHINFNDYKNTLMGEWELQNDSIHFKEVFDFNLLRLYNSSFKSNKNRDSIIKERLVQIDQIKKENWRARTINVMILKKDTLILRTRENLKVKWYLKE